MEKSDVLLECKKRNMGSVPLIPMLENEGRCTIGTLKKAANALGAVLKIDLIPKEKLRKAQ